MKKIISVIVACGVMLFTLPSCSLDYFPNNQVDDSTGVTSVPELRAAMNGVYFNMRMTTGWGRHVLVLPEFVSDAANVFGASANWYFQMEQGTYIEGASELIETWMRLYRTIRDAVTVIRGAEFLLADPVLTPTPALVNEVNSLLSAALAVRALCHFKLAQFFSPAYISDDNARNQLGVVLIGDEFQNPGMPAQRATLYETFVHILADLDRALALGNPVTRTSHFLTQNGVYAIQARVFLYMGRYAAAAAAAQQAIAMSGTLATTSAEILAQFHTTSPTSEDILSLFAGTGAENLGVNSLFVMFNAAGVGTTYGGRLSPLAFRKFHEDDIRLALYTPCLFAGPIADGATWTSHTGEVIDFTGLYAGYVTSKFHGTGTQGQMKTPILRLPEQYLINAEALFRTGNRAGSQAALLPIASRNPNITDAVLTAMTDEEYLQFIWDERARELALEGFRLFDLKRTGQVISRPGLYFGFRAPWAAWTNIQDHAFPIPLAEVTANPTIQRNENWLEVSPPVILAQ